MSLDGKVIIVTGAASGIGAASVVLIRARGGIAISTDLAGADAILDVTSSEAVDAAFAQARAAIGQERILVNCAGAGGSVKTVSRDKPRSLTVFSAKPRKLRPATTL